MLSQSLLPVLQVHLVKVRELHDADLSQGNGAVLSALCAGTQIFKRR